MKIDRRLALGIVSALLVVAAWIVVRRPPRAVEVYLKESVSYSEIQEVLNDVVGAGESTDGEMRYREGIASVEAGGYADGRALLTVHFKRTISSRLRDSLVAVFEASPLIDNVVEIESDVSPRNE